MQKLIPEYTCACGSREWVIWWDCIFCTNAGCDKVYELNIPHPAKFNEERDKMEITTPEKSEEIVKGGN